MRWSQTSQSLVDGWMSMSWEQLKVQAELEGQRLAGLGRAPTLEDEQVLAAAQERLRSQRSSR